MSLIADEVHLHQSYLSSLFKKETGISLKQYISDYRISIAKELLSRVVNEAREKGCGTVQITASDMGVLLYTDFGFTKNNNFMQYKL